MHHEYIYYCSGINHAVQRPSWRIVLHVGYSTVHYHSAATLKTQLTLPLSSPDLLLVFILQKHLEVPAEIMPALLCGAFTLSGQDTKSGRGNKKMKWLAQDGEPIHLGGEQWEGSGLKAV